jgi:protein ImuA
VHVLKNLKRKDIPAPGESLAPGPKGLVLPLGRLHEIVPGGLFHLGTAAGFALALAARRTGHVVWIQQELAALEGGAPYGPGGALFGLDASRLLLVQAKTAKDALWAMEEASRTSGIAAVIGELAGAGEAADLTATRRLNLAMEERGALGLLLRQQPLSGTSACATRWRVAAAPGRGDGLGGIGRTAFAVTLEKNRSGPCGDYLLEWNDDERCFAAHPVAVAAPAAIRPHRAA